MRLSPDRADRGEVLLRARASGLEWDADRSELLLDVADANPEDEPTTGEDVERRELLCKDQRIAEGQDDDSGTQHRRRGQGGQDDNDPIGSRMGSSGSIGDGGWRGSATTASNHTQSWLGGQRAHPL